MWSVSLLYREPLRSALLETAGKWSSTQSSLAPLAKLRRLGDPEVYAVLTVEGARGCSVMSRLRGRDVVRLEGNIAAQVWRNPRDEDLT